jgi:hypothetical protein
MAPRGLVKGRVVQANTPAWKTLEDFVGEDLAGRFMWMFEVELDDGVRMDAYKERWTRGYLHLAEDGRAFEYAGPARGEDVGNYHEVERADALIDVFESRRHDLFTPEDEAELEKALRRAAAADEVSWRRPGARSAGRGV